ncbi:MobT family relaxase [Clostridioides difficile]|uniref:MobT family relaxase n=1 Tax=Enterococcus gallinarum TaxID=1353 RepID=UPI0009E947CD|nr:MULTISPECIES: MobT family relaxase [Bacillota]HAU5032889.1 XRE family transcriptional regulator [Clostridioides difficile]HAU5042131.1 XRE family transcriptional regulator [Clostridioides difficile]HAU5074321.1 XRE family transcriptional regulator [Clostridioides difficile]HAU5077565.1 XRE family transcriptional regulator [Clostridioides difficile]HAU5166977.1 XRE family transcriptional regulator [Clostridioides difficile]
MNESTFITALKEKRLSYGVSQTRLAIMAGISREHLNRIEAGKVKLTDDMQDKLMEAVEKFNPDAPMFLLFDYVRIRFPTLDIRHVIRDILKLNVDYMLHEDYGHYKYTEHYYLGDVFVYTSQDEEKGTLLELKGKGCRQFESYLLAQGRSWYDFLMDALVEGGVMKRLDLAINDRAGILDIPDLTAKCNREECVSLFRSFKSYASGELVKHNEQDKAGMGHTLYIGSLKSEVYFCCYEKNYEQYAKLGIPTSEAPIKNRFEIRLKDERAYYAVRELLTHYDAEQTAFSIINHYIRFVDREPEKRKTDWKLNDRWAWFIGKDRPPVKLTTDPEPYTLERTLGWISRQVAPTLKMLKKIDAGNRTSYLKEIEDNAKLTEKHLQIIRQQTADTEELITE